MIVYIVQKLDWKWNDEAFVLRDDTPVKAFASRRDAETLCEELDRATRVEWEKDRYVQEKRPWIGEGGMVFEPELFYEVVALELEP